MPRLAVVGSLNTDLVIKSPRLPERGETVTGGEFATFPGGKGANQAVAAARLGAQVAMVGALGEDEFGRQLRGGLERDHIDTRHVATIPGTASTSVYPMSAIAFSVPSGSWPMRSRTV